MIEGWHCDLPESRSSSPQPPSYLLPCILVHAGVCQATFQSHSLGGSFCSPFLPAAQQLSSPALSSALIHCCTWNLGSAAVLPNVPLLFPELLTMVAVNNTYECACCPERNILGTAAQRTPSLAAEWQHITLGPSLVTS